MPGYKRELPAQPAALEIIARQGGFWHEIDSDDGPLRAFVRLGKAADGRFVCLGVAFDAQGAEVTARLLRSMPLGELIAEAAAGATGQARFRAEHTTPTGIARTRPGPSGYPPEHYEQVAHLYRQALEVAPRSPTRWLCEQLVAPEPTVRRWVQRARDRGLLGASTPGKAGEITTTKEKEE